MESEVPSGSVGTLVIVATFSGVRDGPVIEVLFGVLFGDFEGLVDRWRLVYGRFTRESWRSYNVFEVLKNMSWTAEIA